MGLHRSVTRLSSSQHINLTPVPPLPAPGPPPVGSHNRSVTAIGAHGIHHRFITGHPSTMRVSSGGVTVTTTPGTVSPTKSIRYLTQMTRTQIRLY
jgi:hypothetical protein